MTKQKVKLSSKWVRGREENPFIDKWIVAVDTKMKSKEMKCNEIKKTQRATQRKKKSFFMQFYCPILDKRHFFQLIVYERHTHIIAWCPPKYVSIVRTLSRRRLLSFSGRKLKLIKILAQFFSISIKTSVPLRCVFDAHTHNSSPISISTRREIWFEERTKEKHEGIKIKWHNGV